MAPKKRKKRKTIGRTRRVFVEVPVEHLPRRGMPRRACGCLWRRVFEPMLGLLFLCVLVLVLSVASNRVPVDDHAQLFETVPFLRHFYDTLVKSSIRGPGFPGAEYKGRAHYPVVMIPGIISTSLELWQGRPCSHSFFRQAWWGGVSMLRAMLDVPCWLEHLALTEEGIDPPGIKLRAAEGLKAADYVLPGYWVWGRVIENLAVVGYDTSSMHLMGYDWRLGYKDLEERDGYFTNVMNTIEMSVAVKRDRAVVLTHSMGAQVFHYFLQWVESPQGGNAPGWVEAHIHAVMHIGGSLLGAPKAVSSILSGEMRDTAQLSILESVLTQKILQLSDRVFIARSWFGMSSLLPRGGSAIWGSEEGAPDDGEGLSHAALVTFRNGSMVHADELRSLLGLVDDAYAHRLDGFYSLGVASTVDELRERTEQRYWSNPLESKLPNSPSTTMMCLYGTGKATERRHFYVDSDFTTAAVPYVVDVLVSDPKNGIEYGVDNSVGDGTVPLISLGYMCAHGWRERQGRASMYNPGNMKVVTREYKHRPAYLSGEGMGEINLRGGVYTGDHVDVMGNRDMLLDVLAVVTKTASLEDLFVSDILNISEKVPLSPWGTP